MKHIKKYFGIMLVIGLSSIIPFYITLAAIKSDPIQYCHEFENEVCSYDFLSIITLILGHTRIILHIQ